MSRSFVSLLLTGLLVAISAVGFAPIQSAHASATIDVLFSNTPLFSEANFLPGDMVTRSVQVTNHAGASVNLGIKLDPYNDPDGLGSLLDVVIKEGVATLYTGTMTALRAADEVFLSSLADTATTQYNISVTFNPSANDNYQGKSMGFDFIIGTLGPTPTPTTLGSSSGGGGGGGGAGVIITPTPTSTPSSFVSPSSTPSVAGTSTPGPTPFNPAGSDTGTGTSGQIAGGVIKGINVNVGPSGEITVGSPRPSVSPSPNAGNVEGTSTCSDTSHYLWWITLILLFIGTFYFLWPSASPENPNEQTSRWPFVIVMIVVGAMFALLARTCDFNLFWLPLALAGASVVISLLTDFW